nr:hypothetical protein [Tanacetum cinerariifolium]
MDRLPSSMVFNIFSRVPVKCLARSRCVSKVWCNYIDDRYLVIIHDKRLVEEPTPILYHQHLSRDRMTRSLCFHVIESKQPGTTHYVWEPKEGPFLEYLRKKPLSKYSLLRIQVRESCGLGFDAFTNTYTMVCVLLKEYAPPIKPDMVKKNLCTMVHVFDTNSWREIPQASSYPITDGGREVIWFDVNKEEFGLIDPPKRMCGLWSRKNMFEEESVPDGYIDVIGCWNKDGDILIKCMIRGDGRIHCLQSMASTQIASP